MRPDKWKFLGELFIDILETRNLSTIIKGIYWNIDLFSHKCLERLTLTFSIGRVDKIVIHIAWYLLWSVDSIMIGGSIGLETITLSCETS